MILIIFKENKIITTKELLFKEIELIPDVDSI